MEEHAVGIATLPRNNPNDFFFVFIAFSSIKRLLHTAEGIMVTRYQSEPKFKDSLSINIEWYGVVQDSTWGYVGMG